MMPTSRYLSALLPFVLTACASMKPVASIDLDLVSDIRVTEHRAQDDLLTAGLGEAGLRQATPPAVADPEHPTSSELRRRAIWSNWRGIADLAPGGGYGTVYGRLDPVPGQEFQALARVPGASQPHRVMVQVPDAFDPGKRCVVVSASSGSRGIYGAIALAGAWGLAHGCAVAYTDKGAGTGYVAMGSSQRVGLDGTPARDGNPPEFDPGIASDNDTAIAVKHAHSGDNPEADWGRHVRQAAQFALEALQRARPQDGPFTFANTRVVAVGVSNGGGAVLRAAELEGDWLDGVVAISPQIYPGEGGRSLFDYATEAAIWMPCALAAPEFDAVPFVRHDAVPLPALITRCASLQLAGELTPSDLHASAEQARGRLHAAGWTDEAIAAGAISVAFDLWRAVAVTYASSYARSGPTGMPCGYGFHALDAAGARRPPSASEQALWWSDASGIPPGAGVALGDAQARGDDPALPGLRCLRALRDGNDPPARQVQASVAATRSNLPVSGLPILVIHGRDDGLVPEAFSSGAYVSWARAAGRDVRYWRVDNAQHFDAFLGVPALGARYVPLLPYAYRGLDALWRHLADGAAMPADATIHARPRTLDANGLSALQAENLGQVP